MKKYLPAVFLLCVFEAVAFGLWLGKNNIFYLFNFSYIGLSLFTGLVLYAVAALVLIFSPADSLGFVLIYVFVAAVAASLVNPRKDALLQLNINPQERARLNALIMASTIALSSPLGYLAGWLSSLDRRLPFVFSFVLFLVAMLVISRIQEPSMEEETA